MTESPPPSLAEQTILVAHHALPIANVYLHFRGGPAFDPPGLEGLTSLTHRMLMRGTRRRGRAELEEAIEALGTEMSTSTQRDAVSIGGSVLGRNLEAFLELLVEVVTEPTFETDELEKVRREIQAEQVSGRDDDATLAAIWFRRTVFRGHPFGHGAVGTAAGLAAITREDVLSFAARLYSRPNLVVGASGDLEAETLLTRLRPLYDALEDAPLVGHFGPPPAVVGRHILLIDKPERSQAQLLIGHPSMVACDPDFLAVSLATTAFGGTFTARLMDEVRVKRGWSYGAYARLASERASGNYMMQAAPALTYAPETMQLIFDEYSRFVDEGLTDDEIEFARGYLLNQHPFRVEVPSLRCGQVVSARILGRPDDSIDTYCDRLRALSPEGVRDAVRRRLRPQDLHAIMVCTAAEVRPKIEAMPGLSSVTVIDANTP